jgi:hypothetical protein
MITTTENGGTLITGNSVLAFRLLALRQAMNFELKTGMKMSRINPFPIVRKEFGIKARNKQAVYDQFCELLTANGIRFNA